MQYKTLTVQTPTSVDFVAAKRVADTINDCFRPGLSIDVNSTETTLQLNEVDVGHLSNFGQWECPDEVVFLNFVVDHIDSVKSYGLRSGRRVFVKYNSERKVKNRKQKEQNRTQHYYSTSFSTHTNALPIDMQDAIICGDSKSIMKNIPDNSIDLIFTSPPYNFGLEYSHDKLDASQWQNYFAELETVWDECIRVLKYGGRIGINVQPLYSDYVPSHHLISQYFLGQGCIWKGEIIWEKNNYNCKYTAWGSWKSPSSPYLKYSWEFVELFCKGSLKKDGRPENADISADDFKKWVYGKWSIAPERKMKEFGHPAMFPVELARRVTQLFSFQGDVVLDPFAGVGTTCVAAKMLGRKYIGIDISDEYCNLAEERLSKIEEPML